MIFALLSLFGCSQSASLQVVVVDDAPTSTFLSGRVQDDQFGEDGEYDLGSALVVASATCEDQRVDVVLESPEPAFGGNTVTIMLHLDEEGDLSWVEARLEQWADFNAYDGEFSRTYVGDGLIEMADFDLDCDDLDNLGGLSASFTFATAVGQVEGAFVFPEPSGD